LVVGGHDPAAGLSRVRNHMGGADKMPGEHVGAGRSKVIDVVWLVTVPPVR